LFSHFSYLVFPDLGITEADIPALAEQAITDVCTPGNPREVTKEDILALYHQIL